LSIIQLRGAVALATFFASGLGAQSVNGVGRRSAHGALPQRRDPDWPRQSILFNPPVVFTALLDRNLIYAAGFNSARHINPKEPVMKILAVSLAGALALSSTFAFAQAGSSTGATVPEKSGTASNVQGGVAGTTTDGKTTSTAGAAKTRSGTNRRAAKGTAAGSRIEIKAGGTLNK
jgi:hypothetical protein